jgi:hypothetical protein
MGSRYIYIFFFLILFHFFHLTEIEHADLIEIEHADVQVSGVEHKNATVTIAEHLSITEAEAKDLLLVTKRDKQSFDIDLGKLRAKFKDSTISDENLASHVKAYLLYLLGEVLLNTPSSNTISYIYLPFLDIDRIDSYAIYIYIYIYIYIS